jgi:carbon storage regulator
LGVGGRPPAGFRTYKTTEGAGFALSLAGAIADIKPDGRALRFALPSWRPWAGATSSGLPWKEPQMLVLSRQRDEMIVIGDDIEITVVDIRGEKVRLGINAPAHISVHRKEVYDAIKREKEAAAQGGQAKVESLAKKERPPDEKPKTP